MLSEQVVRAGPAAEVRRAEADLHDPGEAEGQMSVHGQDARDTRGQDGRATDGRATVLIDLEATSKGRPSGVFARMPDWLIRCFTWKRVSIGHVMHRQEFPVGSVRLILADQALQLEVDRDLSGIRVLVAAFVMDRIELPVVGVLAVRLSGGGFEVRGFVSVTRESGVRSRESGVGSRESGVGSRESGGILTSG
jgi:hypothetical protein